MLLTALTVTGLEAVARVVAIVGGVALLLSPARPRQSEFGWWNVGVTTSSSVDPVCEAQFGQVLADPCFGTFDGVDERQVRGLATRGPRVQNPFLHLVPSCVGVGLGMGPRGRFPKSGWPRGRARAPPTSRG